MIELTATRQEFTVADESGYRFTVVAEQDPDTTGWRATVTITSRGGTGGFVTSMGAIGSLDGPLEHLLRMLRESATP